jgi:Type IV secretion-system coupling protein DNA-binding domain
MGWFTSKDEKETLWLRANAARLRSSSCFQSKGDMREYIIDLLVEACGESDLCISAIVAEPLGDILWKLLYSEPFTFDAAALPEKHETLRTAAREREWLRHCIKVLESEEHYLLLWRRKAKVWLLGIVDALPVAALVDPYPDGTLPETPALFASTPLHALIEDFPLVISRTCCTFLDADVSEAGLFYSFRDDMERKLCAASGIPWKERFSSKRKVDLPSEKKGLPDAELIALYTEDTLLSNLFTLPIPIVVPDEVRFEHTHIVGGTGHGKTQLLQYLIMHDLHRALDTNMSLVVIDPDGSLIRTISQTDYFGEYLLADRAIFIDPSEVDRPVSLNLFDVSHLEGADARTRETIENNTIELFEYFFDALLGSELTGKQTTLFRYLGLLLMQIPGGNIHTLRKIMEDVRPYKPYIEKLPDTARAFFETRFASKDLQATKTQVLSRLWGVLSNRSLDRVLSGTKNSINFDDALQSGKIIFIHTSKENLGEEGSAIFARMMVALIGQALIRRAAIPAQERTDTFIYIDEAEGVVDQTLVRLLAQTRKYRGAITIAHQHLDQLTPSARAGVFANTSIKLAGGMSAKDASALASEMRTKPETLLSFRKDKQVSRFALFAKNYTETAMTLEVPLGYAESCERLDADDYATLLEQSRAWYGRAVPETTLVSEQVIDVLAEIAPMVADPLPIAVESSVIAEVSGSETPQPVVRKEGGGGARHQAICQTIKELGEVAGFRASIEETILDGEGRVDVILRQGERAIAFEVSVTTSREHELLNVRKCLRAGFQEVVLVASLPRHLLSLERYIPSALDENEHQKLRFVLADDLGSMFDGNVETDMSEKVVRGWSVRSTLAGSEAAMRSALSAMFGDDV